MALREKLIYAIGLEVDSAKKGLADFRSSVMGADGPIATLKAGAASAFASITANAGLLAAGAGAALVTFGIKAVGAFTDTAKAAIDLSTATGLGVEAASRWIAIGDDYQVTAEALATGLGKITKNLDDEKWAKYGIATRDAAGNARDANDILLDTFGMLSGVRNETERARIGQELFARGYQSLTPILGHTREEYEKMLDAQMAGQVITEAEAKKAEKTRLALDNLHDSMQELTLAAGQLLAPAMEEVANDLAGVAQGAVDAGNAIGKVPGLPELLKKWNPVTGFLGTIKAGLQEIGDEWHGAKDEVVGASDQVYDSLIRQGTAYQAAKQESLAASTEVRHHRSELEIFHETVDLSTAAIKLKADADKKAADADKKAADAADRHTEAVDGVTRALEAQTDAAVNLVGGDIAVRNAQDDAAEAAKNLNDVLDNQSTTLGEAGDAIDEAAQSQLDAANAAANYRAQQMEANGEAVTAKVQAQLFKEELQKLVGQLDGPLAAALQTYIDSLDSLDGRNVRTTITLTTAGRVGDTTADPRVKGKRAAGGSTMAGGLYEVTENGSEILEENGRRYLMAGANGNVVPLNGKSSGAAGGGTTHNHFYGVLDSRMVEQIRRQTERATRGRL